MKTVALGVSSSIGIYKACEVLRGLQKEGCAVRVVMTPNATRLVSPLLFSALSGQDAVVETFDPGVTRSIGHISLAREISLLVVAPATANVIAKFASGLADDFLSTFFLAVRCPVLVAPAMNEAMYLHPATQANLKTLAARGVAFIEPEKGSLACGTEGWGRLAEPDKIVREGLRLMGRTESLRGKTVLITAGPTREFLDPVRFVSNPSTGKMGYALAEEALDRGACVILVSGPTHLVPPAGAEVLRVENTEDMKNAVDEAFPRTDVVIMAAAPADFAFEEIRSQKAGKKSLSSSLAVRPTPDILQELGRRKGRAVLVGFAAETDDIEARAVRKMKVKALDLIVANDVGAEGIGFGADENSVRMMWPSGEIRETGRMSKRDISRVILDAVEDILEK
ncbi:MAG: bifunctional phosphopantothenoylcysteine decarboxylase/phosphopantothenate--cysteine ligase CoaBC [Acidobacteriota bacterium]|nr:bifunctional phosphopantothenoylcysteine decarboxylase/phosphopantothenate--cysteine ligase CoaBC [Acidobacteriota bacterium]